MHRRVPMTSPDPDVRSRHSVRDLVLVLVLMVTTSALAPVAVRAVGSVVGIADNDSDTDLARVDSGKLRVGDGAGNLTVDGSVIQAHHPVANVFTAGLDPGNQVVVFPGGGVLGSQRLATTSLILNNVGTTSVEVNVRSTTVSSSSTCSGAIGSNLLKVRLSAGESEEFMWPATTPFSLFATSGRRLCAQLALPSAPTGTAVNAMLTYYLGPL